MITIISILIPWSLLSHSILTTSPFSHNLLILYFPLQFILLLLTIFHVLRTPGFADKLAELSPFLPISSFLLFLSLGALGYFTLSVLSFLSALCYLTIAALQEANKKEAAKPEKNNYLTETRRQNNQREKTSQQNGQTK